MKKRLSLILVPAFMFFLFCGQSLSNQDEKKKAFIPETKFPVSQLKEDFTLLRTALETAHASLYFYTPKEEMDGLFKSLYTGLDSPKTELEFYGYLAPLIAEINNGHTRLIFSQDYDTYLRNQPILMPFKLLFIDGKAYLFRNYSMDEDVELDGEVMSINGFSMSEILKKNVGCSILGWS